MKWRWPVITPVILAVSAVGLLSPLAAGWLIYDRELILQGELWRLLTGVFVHFSADHLFYDALVFGLAGGLAERNNRSEVGILCAVTALAGGLFLLLARREIGYYGGLSGLAVMSVVCLGLREAKHGGPAAFWWQALMAVVALKIIFEVMTGGYIFAASDRYIALPSMHIIGGLTALVSFIMRQRVFS